MNEDTGKLGDDLGDDLEDDLGDDLEQRLEKALNYYDYADEKARRKANLSTSD